MATRSVIVRLEAQVAGYVAGLGRAATATDLMAKKAAQARKSVQDNSQAMQTAGTALVAFGAVAVAGLAAATKAAIDWESAWAGVTKTVDGSPEQMDALEGSLRGLAKTLPATHKEIAGVAEAAGALGVAREDVVGFTKTMVDLGETTNLTADEAATSIAQIANVTGLMEREGAAGVAKFGSALVALGNDGASTEAEILSMAQRIAGAGVQIGLTEGEILGMASALSSVGIEAEAGGSAISTIMIKIAAAVDSGGAELEKWAGAAGMTGEQFKKAFQEDAAGALDTLVQGLGNAEATGQTTLGMLEDLGITEIRTRDAMLRLASAGGLLADSFETGNSAFAENTALLEEATKRYETTEAKITVAWNNIKDSAITAGGAMLPVVAGMAEGAVALAQAFGSLPEPVQGGLTMIGGIVGVTALAAGGFLTLVPRIMETRQAFRDLDAAGSKVPGMMGKIGKAAGIAAAGLVAFESIKGLHNSVQPATASLEEFTQALIRLDDNRKALDNMFSGIDFGAGSRWEGEIGSAGEALDELINQDWSTAVESFGASVLKIDNGMSKMADAVAKADQSIASAANSGNMDLAAKGFKSIAESAEAQGVSLEETFARFPEYEKALRDQAIAAEADVSEQELLAWAMGEIPPAMQEAAKATDEVTAAAEAEAAAAEESARVSEEMAEALEEIGVSAEGTVTNLTAFTTALVNAGLLTLSSRDSARQYQASLDALTESIATNGVTLDTNTEAGRANEAALDGIMSAGLAYAEALATETDALGRNVNSQKDVQAALQQTYDDYYANALAMTGNAEAAEALTRKVMGIPDDVSIETFMGETAKLMADATTGAIDTLPESVYIEAAMSAAAEETARSTKQAADDVPEQETIDAWMSDAAFWEAVRTRAAALGIPEKEVIDSFMSSAARNEADATTSQVLGIPKGASVTSFMEAYARHEAERTKAAIDAIPRSVYTKITTERAEILTSTDNRAPRSSLPVRGHALGGAIVGFGGTPGKDSVPIMAMPDEHMLTVRDVAAMGGHEGVYRFRKALHSGSAGFRVGGGVGHSASSREYSAAAYAPQASGPVQMVGTLMMDGNILGTFKGVAVEAARGEIHQQSSRAATYRRG